jgi:hypothetical protein
LENNICMISTKFQSASAWRPKTLEKQFLAYMNTVSINCYLCAIRNRRNPLYTIKRLHFFISFKNSLQIEITFSHCFD